MKNNIKCLRSILVLLTLISFGAIATIAPANQSGLRIPEQVTGDLAYEHLEYLTEEIGVRVTGTEGAEDAADYIIDQFSQMGYDVEIQPFTFDRRGTIYTSENIIATKHGKFDQTVIVGAHYDSVSERVCEEDGNVSSGAGDNASGVGVMLEAAEVLSNYKTKGTIKFIAFGAEEMGLRGSRYYASQMSDEEIANTVTMIDLDSVGVGDFFYVYAGLDDNPGWARDLALKIGQRIGHDLRTSPQSELYFN